MGPPGTGISDALGDRRVEGRARPSAFRGILRRLPWYENRVGAVRLRHQSLPAPGPGRESGADRHRPWPMGLLYTKLFGCAERALRQLSLAFYAFPQDRRLRQPAARRHLGALALLA